MIPYETWFHVKVSLFFVFNPLLASVYNSWSQQNNLSSWNWGALPSKLCSAINIFHLCFNSVHWTLTLRFWSKQIYLGLAIVNSISCFNYYFVYTRDEAEMEYLKIAQDLEMYGVSYFEIKVL